MNSPQKSNLETLLRLKQAERPVPAFWQRFDQELRRKQLAATIEPKPWWLGLSLLSRKLAIPVAAPAGAAAALLLAFVAYERVPSAQPHADHSPALEPSVDLVVSEPNTTGPTHITPKTGEPPAPKAIPSPSTALASTDASSTARASTTNPRDTAPTTALTGTEAPPQAALASLLPADIGLPSHAVASPPSVSTLAAVENEPPSPLHSLHHFAGDVSIAPLKPSDAQIPIHLASLTQADADHTPGFYELAAIASATTNLDALETVNSELGAPHNARLLALMDTAGQIESAPVVSDITRRQSARLSDDMLYASASRLGIGGNHVSIRF